MQQISEGYPIITHASRIVGSLKWGPLGGWGWGAGVHIAILCSFELEGRHRAKCAIISMSQANL